MFKVGEYYFIDINKSDIEDMNKDDVWKCICTDRAGPKYHPIIFVNGRNGSIATSNELGYGAVGGKNAKFIVPTKTEDPIKNTDPICKVKAIGPLDIDPEYSDLPENVVTVINNSLIQALAQRGLNNNRNRISLRLNRVLNHRQKGQLINMYTKAGWSDVIIKLNSSEIDTYIYFVF